MEKVKANSGTKWNDNNRSPMKKKVCPKKKKKIPFKLPKKGVFPLLDTYRNNCIKKIRVKKSKKII